MLSLKSVASPRWKQGIAGLDSLFSIKDNAITSLRKERWHGRTNTNTQEEQLKLFLHEVYELHGSLKHTTGSK